jgi:hypothetical protein
MIGKRVFIVLVCLNSAIIPSNFTGLALLSFEYPKHYPPELETTTSSGTGS